MCERLGVAPAATVYVGDSLESDALGACAAGLTGIWLDRPGAAAGGRQRDGAATVDHAPALRITSLAGLPEPPGPLGTR